MLNYNKVEMRYEPYPLAVLRPALDEDHFDIAVIPKTWELTNLSSLDSGDAVNLEADVIAKYVERMLGLER